MRSLSILCAIPAALLAAAPLWAQPLAASGSIVAYGRVVPGEEIMALTLPYYQGAPQLVAKLMVRENDQVTAGQLLVVASNHEVAAASLAQAEAHAAAVAARLMLVREGAKPEDVAAQAALVASEQFDVTQGRQQLARSAALREHDAVSEMEWQNDTARLGSLEAKVVMSLHTLDSMKHPRPTDIVVAEADLAEAKAAVAVAQSSLGLTELRAPSDGQILKIVTYAGEQPGDHGVLLFGNTGAMQIKAEVDISEVARVRVGALAQATAPAWAGTVAGKVVRIAPHVDHSSILPPSTFASVDRRVVDVTVALDNPKTIAAFSGAEAIVTIATSP